MIRHNIPLLMVLAFLGLTLVVGLCTTQKTTTFREYAVGNKRFHTNTLVCTVLATVYGGATLMVRVLTVYMKSTLATVFIYLIMILINDFILIWLSLRMGPFMEHLSIAETIGSVYGKYPRIIVAVLAICFSIGMVALEIHVMNSFISICIDSIDPPYRDCIDNLNPDCLCYAWRGACCYYY